MVALSDPSRVSDIVKPIIVGNTQHPLRHKKRRRQRTCGTFPYRTLRWRTDVRQLEGSASTACSRPRFALNAVPR